MRKIEMLMDKLFRHHRWSVHLVYWFTIMALYVIFFGRQTNNYLQTIFFVGLIMPVTIGATYVLNYILVPNYLLKERYYYFFMYFIYALIGAIFLELVIAMATFILLAGLNVRNMSPASIDIFFLITSTLMVVFCSMAMKLLLYYRTSKENFQILQCEKVEAELKFLKTQLNPHFLFNTLNNLYYLASEKSAKAPQAILQLSEILDYAMNSSKVDSVPFEAEWKQVSNYIALESLRCEGVHVSLQLHGSANDVHIPPMIIMTLVENAFKHGVMRVAGNSWIAIIVNLDPLQTRINVRNSSRKKDGGHGIGLVNLRNQLQLLFENRHELLILDQHPGEYEINLKLSR
jgi:sensor histidine kinase YesM